MNIFLFSFWFRAENELSFLVPVLAPVWASYSQGMWPWQPILGKIGELTFINIGIPKWIQLSKYDLQILNGCIFLLHLVQAVNEHRGSFNYVH